MEGLASGAMIMIDVMVPLPFCTTTIVNIRSCVIYSIGSLKLLLTFYLEHDKEQLKTARVGHHIVMLGHRRSWHRME